MDSDERKVSARELLGTAFDERPVREVPQEKIAIYVYSIGPNRQRENLTQGQPIEGYLDLEDLEKQFGVGRFYLVAKHKETGTVITQKTVDVTRQTPHPLSVQAEVPEAAVEVENQGEEVTAVLDMVVSKLQDLEQKMNKKPNSLFGEGEQAELQGGTLMERMFLRMLDQQTNTKQSQADQMQEILMNALSVQKEAMLAASQFQIEEKRDDLETRRLERARKWDREDMAFEAKAALVSKRMESIQGTSQIDPDGGNAMTLVDAIKDIIGEKNSLNIFGFDLSMLLEPIVPQLAKALEDRGLYIVAKKQMEMIVSTSVERGRVQGQQEAIDEMTGEQLPEPLPQRPPPPPRPQPPQPQQPEGAATDGPDDRQGDNGAEDDPGPDDQESR
jgi:hypothetical protein